MSDPCFQEDQVVKRGSVGALKAGIAALSMPFFVKRWGKERAIGLGTIGVALSLLPLGLIPHWVAAEIGFVGAIAISAMQVAAFAVYGQELVSQGWRAITSGSLSMGGGIGGSLIVILGGSIITIDGYQTFYLTAACLTAVGGLLFLIYFCKARGKFIKLYIKEPAD